MPRTAFWYKVTITKPPLRLIPIKIYCREIDPETTARRMARSSTRYRKRHKRRGGSGSDSEASSQSSSSPETLEEEAAGAEESGAGPGQDGDTTDSDDEGVLGVWYSWSKKWTGTRGDQPIRGRTLTGS